MLNRSRIFSVGVALVAAALAVSPSALARDDGSDSTKPAAAPAPDKSEYWLFNPTPQSQMREFWPDRPDVTEDPHTVDAGHVQIESSFAEYTHAKDGDIGTELWSVLPTEVRIGILNTAEFSVAFEPFLDLQTHSSATSNRSQGFGDLDLRLKINLWGDEGDGPAFAIIPHVTIPTADRSLGDGHVEGGIIFAYSMELPGDFDLAAMIETDGVRNAANDGYGTQLVYSASLDRQIAGPLGAYVEYLGIVPLDLAETHTAYFGGGFTWLLNKNVQLDIGIDKGLTRSAFDYDIFSGIAWRW